MSPTLSQPCWTWHLAANEAQPFHLPYSFPVRQLPSIHGTQDQKESAGVCPLCPGSPCFWTALFVAARTLRAETFLLTSSWLAWNSQQTSFPSLECKDYRCEACFFYLLSCTCLVDWGLELGRGH